MITKYGCDKNALKEVCCNRLVHCFSVISSLLLLHIIYKGYMCIVHVHMYVCACVHAYVHTYVRRYMYICKCMHACMNMHEHVCGFAYSYQAALSLSRVE